MYNEYMKKYKIGDRIQLKERMVGEIFGGKYNGIEVGEKGEVTRVAEFPDETILSVNWDNGRRLNVLIPQDKVDIIN